MAQKNNIRSIRFSDELAELIDRQIGDTFTQKFENLITTCVFTLPHKEAEIQRLDEMIERKRKELRTMQEQYSSMSDSLYRITPQLRALESAIKREVQKWDTEEV